MSVLFNNPPGLRKMSFWKLTECPDSWVRPSVQITYWLLCPYSLCSLAFFFHMHWQVPLKHCLLTSEYLICSLEYGFCQIWGDPHYRTFDKKQYDFQGGCQYTLVKKCKGRDLPDFHLIGDNKRRNEGDRVSYQREIKLRYRGHEYYVRRNYVSVDDVSITLPLLNHAGVTIHYDAPFTVWHNDLRPFSNLSALCNLLRKFVWSHRNEI